MRRRAKGWVPMAADPRWRPFVARYCADLPRFAREVTRLDISEQQHELMVEVQAPRSRVSVASGHGCFARGTWLMRADGRRVRVEDVVPGDMMMGPDGVSSREVLRLARGVQRMYAVVYEGGSVHVVNRSHVLCLTDGQQQLAVSLVEWLDWPAETRSQYTAYKLVEGGAEPEYVRVAIVGVECIGVHRYYGFALAGDDGRFLAANGIVLHNTGKTTSIATIVLWHLLCFSNSVTLLTANDMDQLKATLWKEFSLALERLRLGPHGWIYAHVDLLANGSCRIVGYEETWFIESKTANEKSANKMAGRHAKWLMVIGDEASTLPEAVCTTLNGALTEEYNRFLLTSQPTRNAGFFYDTFHRLSKVNGGDWVNLVLSSVDSPFVSDAALLNLWETYDEDERRIRLLGLFPADSSKHMMPLRVAEAMYRRGKIIRDDEPYGWIVPADIANGEGLRDKAALLAAKVIGYGQRGENARRVEIHKIPIFTNKIRVNVLANHARHHGSEYEGVTYAIDAGGVGVNVCMDLEDGGAVVKRIVWGKPCFLVENKERYINLRAQAMHQAALAAKDGRLSILTHDHKRAMLDQSSRIPKTFSGSGLLQVPAKGSPDWDGLGSPDLWDTVCFLFMEGVDYVPVGGQGGAQKSEEEKLTEDMDAEAARAFADVS